MRLFSKFATAGRILQSSPHPWASLHWRFRHNLACARLGFRADGWFRYRTRLGFSFLVDREESMTFWLYTQGHPDVEELQVLRRWVCPGDTCFDVGANIGYMTALLASRAGSSGQVWAIEPAPATFGRLERCVSRLRLPGVTLVQACVGARSGTTTFYVTTDPGASPLQSMAPPEAAAQAFSPVTVPLLTLDDLVGRAGAGCEPAIVKVDVEGFEADVLTGASRLLRSPNPPLFDLEINRQALARARVTVTDIVEKLGDCYELCFINLSPWQPGHPWPLNRLIPLPSTADTDYPDLGSLIAVPRAGAFAARRQRLPLGTTAAVPSA